MASWRTFISRLLTFTLVLAVFAGSVGMIGMGHPAPQVEDATAQHQMHNTAGMAQLSHDGEGGMQTTDAECAMTICCFADVDAPRAEPVGGALKACFAAMVANPALQPAPDRADKPPKRA